MSTFSGIWIPLVTPFANGKVDDAALRHLVAHYKKAGVSGFVALGTTGEPSSLSTAEQEAVLSAILEAATSTPVVVGLSGNNIDYLKGSIAHYNQLPVAGILVSAPYYVRPSQSGLVDHFLSLADVSDKPLIIYDIPYRTGVGICIDTLLRLAEHPRIKAVKDCARTIEKTLALILDGRLQVLAGDDINILSTLCMGGVGAIAASAHVRPETFVAVHNAMERGDIKQARSLFHQIVPLIRALGVEPNPAPVKAALAQLGLIGNVMRPPMTSASRELQVRLTGLLH
ncbi:4-hydroxy-tetrahydrodipicolinate synthase [Paraburkholderia sp. BL27I4N3]|uniref:4-hydroxy-tetrahydrodipicolinate synthase n=1 Tax=Paraburkholderia sp. BL27I4N3 TaxID=1938805 RepID=UPI000E274E39|nr:4-hydroxy-tetrahydrodipicolinate synthase [Paraburkholderia sp. BL27I4N3]REE07417.1 4-hydroxy-tetrahydrodipicolinate synthase [Paraburkholderia sp. BL27I4N3]